MQLKIKQQISYLRDQKRYINSRKFNTIFMDLNTIKSIGDAITNKILKELLEPNSAIVNG